MELVLKMNTEKLFDDTQKVKHRLEMLEKYSDPLMDCTSDNEV
jgi:hypothetical protein